MTLRKLWQVSARLARMDRAEWKVRVRQELNKWQDEALLRLGHKFLAPVPDRGRTPDPRFFFGPDDFKSRLKMLRERMPEQADAIIRQAEQLLQHRFDLLGYKNLAYGTPIDWHLDAVNGKRAPRKVFHRIRYLDFAEVGDSKVTWELNRHQHFVTLAKAFRLTSDDRFKHEIMGQWEHWWQENPYPVGVNWASSLEVAFRSLAWLWTCFILEDLHVIRRHWLPGLALHGRHIERYLSTYFSPNTHLLGEGVALFFLGVLCPELDAAERWQRTGWKIIQQEAQRQVRADGFHFEQSTYYHVYALDFFLHATILATANQWPVPIALEETVEKMLSALGLLCPAGLPPRWGDDDGGRVFDPRRNRAEHMLDPLATGAILFRRGDFKAAVGQLREETIWLLGPQGVKVWDGVDTQAANIGSTALAASGFYLFPSVTPSAFLAVDCGPMGTQSGGHGHADSLSLTLQSEGCELLIDPGTFTYASAGGERNRFRGTAMHNTLKVDALDQAEPTGPFSWRRLPRCKREKWIQGKRFDLLVASHDGYGRLPQPVTHQRWVFSLQNGIYLVRDCVHGQGEHRLEYFWHLGSEMEQVEGTRFRVKGGSRGLAILYDDVAFPEPQLADSGWSPAYGQRAPARSVTFSRTADLPSASSILLVTLQEALEFQGKFEQLACNDGDGSLSAYRFTAENAEYNFFFAEGGRVWRHGFLSSDAEFICWSREAKNDAQRLILINGSHAEIGEDVELRFRRTILWAELARGKNQREIFSSDLEALADDVASV